jgi:hypothetical protein
MLTLLEKGHPTASRIRGKDSIVKALRRLLLRTHRFGRGRARSAADIRWCALVLDGLTSTLSAAERDARPDAH